MVIRPIWGRVSRLSKGVGLMFKLNQQTTIIVLLLLLVLKQYGVL